MPCTGHKRLEHRERRPGLLAHRRVIKRGQSARRRLEADHGKDFIETPRPQSACAKLHYFLPDRPYPMIPSQAMIKGTASPAVHPGKPLKIVAHRPQKIFRMIQINEWRPALRDLRACAGPSKRVILIEPRFAQCFFARAQIKPHFHGIRPADREIELRAPVARDIVGHGFGKNIRKSPARSP